MAKRRRMHFPITTRLRTMKGKISYSPGGHPKANEGPLRNEPAVRARRILPGTDRYRRSLGLAKFPWRRNLSRAVRVFASAEQASHACRAPERKKEGAQ